MDRYWLLTWTTYGTWLAGDERGFVSNEYAPDGGPDVCHNDPGTEYDAKIPTLEGYVRGRMLADPYYLVREQADVMITQYQDTARIGNFELCAASVMFNHTHLVVGVPGDPDPHHVRELFKNWATRALKKSWALPANGSFWTKKGSVRKEEGTRCRVRSSTWRGSSPIRWQHSWARTGVRSSRNTTVAKGERSAKASGAA